MRPRKINGSPAVRCHPDPEEGGIYKSEHAYDAGRISICFSVLLKPYTALPSVRIAVPDASFPLPSLITSIITVFASVARVTDSAIDR